MSASLNADVLVKLTISRKPELRDKSTGGQFTFAKGREGNGDGARWWALFVYNEAARAEIDRLDVGDVVSIQGSFDAGIWDGRGKPEVSLKINVDRAVALKPPPRERNSRRSHEGITHLSTLTGRNVQIPENRVVELSEIEAEPLLKNGLCQRVA